MSQDWYYVQNGERQGPVTFEEALSLFNDKTLSGEDYVWTKGYENWKKIKDIKEFNNKATAKEFDIKDIPKEIKKDEQIWDLTELKNDINIIFVRIGVDRGGAAQEYGPFSIDLMQRLYKEKRINGKTQVFIQGMADWKFLTEMPGFEDTFLDKPARIKDSDRRDADRKPFIARMFIQSRDQVLEGICRDISIGGMQVLVDHYPGKVGDIISINVHPENSEHHFVASGEIVRMLEGNLGFSFRFINLKEDAINAINGYISKQ